MRKSCKDFDSEMLTEYASPKSILKKRTSIKDHKKSLYSNLQLLFILHRIQF